MMRPIGEIRDHLDVGRGKTSSRYLHEANLNE